MKLKSHSAWSFAVPLLLLLACSAEPVATTPEVSPLVLEPCEVEGVELFCGTYGVWEDRASGQGRRLDLAVVRLPALDPLGGPPVFFFAGGPGQASTTLAPFFARSPFRRQHDVVFVDQRGTAGNHHLDCELWPAVEDSAETTGDDLQRYLDPEFVVEPFVRCRDRLAKHFDLTRYDTRTAVDDFDEVRAALGYDEIFVAGGSYGTRVALTYLERHGDHVRGAVLNGVMPRANSNPLHHARGAQRSFDKLLAACASQEECATHHPDLAADLAAVLDRLDGGPAAVTVDHPLDGSRVEVRLSREAFAEALRGMLYRDASWRRLPALLSRAAAGDLAPFASYAIETNQSLFGNLAYGMLLSVTCAEDLARIDPDSVPAATEGTFYGDHRVRSQLAVCEAWPQRPLDPSWGEAVRSSAPVLMLSGDLDPVTPPHWAEALRESLPNSRHVIVPRTHFVRDACTRDVTAEFLRTADPETLDVGCVGTLEPLILETAASG